MEGGGALLAWPTTAASLQITMEIHISNWTHKFQKRTGLDAKANLELYKSNRVCSVIGIVFKVLYQNWVLIGQFLSDLKDSHIILTRTVWKIWTCFQNQNQTILAQTTTILANLIVCTLWTFHREGGRRYYNGPQPMTLALIWPSWCHQNRRFSSNVIFYARSNQP